jgi:hypothetical protein
MLFTETVAVYRENHTEYTDTVRTSQETHYFPATETNCLRLFTEKVTVYFLQLQLIYDRQSVGQSVLVSGAHLGPVTNFSFSLKFLLDTLWNANGLSQHVAELQTFISQYNIDIMLISETHFTDKSYLKLEAEAPYSSKTPYSTTP